MIFISASGYQGDRHDRHWPARLVRSPEPGAGRRCLAGGKLPVRTHLNRTVAGTPPGGPQSHTPGLGLLAVGRLVLPGPTCMAGDCLADACFARACAIAWSAATRSSLTTAAARPLVIQISIGGTSACHVPMVCPPPEVTSTGTLAWCSWSSCAKYSALLTSAGSPCPAPSQNIGVCAPAASARTSSIGVFCARSCLLPPNGSTSRLGFVSLLRAGVKYPLIDAAKPYR